MTAPEQAALAVGEAASQRGRVDMAVNVVLARRTRLTRVERAIEDVSRFVAYGSAGTEDAVLAVARWAQADSAQLLGLGLA